MRWLITALCFALVFPATAQNSQPKKSVFDRAIELDLEPSPLDPVVKRAEFLTAIEKIKTDVSRCWKQPPDFKGRLRYRITIDRKGTAVEIVPYTDNTKSKGIERIATAAIVACQPLVVRKYYKGWQLIEVTLSDGVEVASLADVPSEERAQMARALAASKNVPKHLQLTSDDVRTINDRIKKCWDAKAFKHSFDVSVDLYLNTDGTVKDATKVLDGPDSNYDKAVLDAIKKCQPYSLSPEKYEQWKRMFLVFQMPKS